MTTAELVLVDESQSAEARRIRRLASSGELRRIYAGVYTSNRSSSLESIVLRNWRNIVGHLLPGAVISYRSGFDLKPRNGQIVVTRGRTRRQIALPGLVIDVIPGPGPSDEQTFQDGRYGALWLASDARKFLENLTRGRGWATRVLPQAELEAALDRILMLGGERRLNQLRDAAKEAAAAFGYVRQLKRLDTLIGALLGTHEAKILTARQAVSRAAGRAYDPDRIVLFDVLFEALKKTTFEAAQDPAPNGDASENFAFFEAYFSNYIEGTTFTVEEAEEIVFERKIIANRSEDSHEILATFEAAIGRPWRDQPPDSADDFMNRLRGLNGLVMRHRPDHKPGEWKDKVNQAGSTIFVAPELVQGTLREAFDRITALSDPFARAVMTMFIVAEVHPFFDGNGRTARLAMNCHLTAAGQSRIIVPTLYREDYLVPLKAMSHNADPVPLIRSLDRIHRWSAAFDYATSRSRVRAALAQCNAFEEDGREFKLLFPASAMR